MALDNYANLKQAVIKQSHRRDLDLKIDDFITLTESEFKAPPVIGRTRIKPLSNIDMEGGIPFVTSLSTREHDVLPATYVSCRDASITVDSRIYPLTYRTPQQLNIRSGAGTPCFFTVRDGRIEFDILSDIVYTAELTVVTSITHLDSVNTTNEILTKYPNLYLYGCLRHAAIYTNDPENENRYTSLFLTTLESVNQAEKDSIYITQPQITVRFAP